MVKLIQDDIIYRLQKKGGITRYWNGLKTELSKNKEIDVSICSTNSLVKYFFNIPPSFKGNHIFHSSYYFSYSGENIKSVLTLHDFMPEKYWVGKQKYKHLLLKRIALSRASHLVFINDHLMEEFCYFYPAYKNLPYSVIKHGNSFDFHIYSESFENYFVYIGSLDVTKNVKFLAGLFEKNNDLNLVCIGFTEADFLLYCEKNNIRRERLNNISVMGYVDDMNLKRIVRQSLAVIVPSIDEGFGLPAIEAIALGVPVLASNIPSFKELLVERYLVPIDNFDKSEMLIRQLSTNENIRKNIYLEQLSIVEKLSWNNAATEYTNVYSDLYNTF